MPEALLTISDVQHNNAIHLKTPNNRYIVFDHGTSSLESDSTSSTFAHLTNNEKQLDSTISCYPHVDYIDDIMMSDPQIGESFCPVHLDRQPIQHGMTNPDKPKNRYFKIHEYNQSSSPDILPNYPDTWGGLSIQILTPARTSENNVNNYSHVIVIELEGLKILIPGDNGPPSWNDLRLTNIFLAVTVNIDVLIAPHYGKDCGFDMDIMRHFNPRLTVISDGNYQDLSAIGRYSAISRGWVIYDPNDSPSQRSCLTTGNDGIISISFGRGEDDGLNFLYVRKSRQSSCSDRF
jgi:hypothetical protein